nr:RNA-directed DNA polymerase, eukaryota [Tanacetum cinerariifolium]
KAEVPTRWLRVVPIKVNVHAWRVCLDKLTTRANLALRGMDISSIACPFWKAKSTEDCEPVMVLDEFLKFDEQNEDNIDSEDEQFVGTIKEDFGGSDGEMEGENYVSVVPDTVREEENNCKKVDIKRTGDSLLTVMEELIKVDFNEVRYKNERYGSVFHAHGADVFNSFILNANLQEISLGGCAFTWCHRSASKMSKLDRFLMLEGLVGANSNFSAITLDRYLSDHRPIMLRESFHDYGPIPFRSFHYWFEIDGFKEMISKAWCESPAIKVNPMLKLMYKMKYLKKRIREWNVNGSPTEEFQFYKGLKQGDLLYPFLFILVMESLHLAFKRVEDAGIAVSVEKVEEVTKNIGCGVLKTPFSFYVRKLGVYVSDQIMG